MITHDRKQLYVVCIAETLHVNKNRGGLIIPVISDNIYYGVITFSVTQS